MNAPMTPSPVACEAASAAPRERRAGRSRRRFAWYRRHVWLATAALILVVVAAGFVTLQIVVRDRVGDGVTVAGLELQGQTAARARETLARELVPRGSAVQLQTGDGEPLTLTLAQLGMSVDVPATARAALARGRHRLPLGLVVWLPGGGGDVAPVVRVNAAAYQQGLEAVRAAVDVPARDAAPRHLRGRRRRDGRAVPGRHDGRRRRARARHRAERRARQGLYRDGADEGRAAAGEHGRRRGARRRGGHVSRAAAHASLPRADRGAQPQGDGRHAQRQHPAPTPTSTR